MAVDLNLENEDKNKLEFTCLSNESTHLDAFNKIDRSKSLGSTHSGNFILFKILMYSLYLSRKFAQFIKGHKMFFKMN